MYTFNIPARKYVYPALLLLFLLFMLLRQIHAADGVSGASPTRASSEVVDSMNQARSDMNNATRNVVQNAREHIGSPSAGVQNAYDDDDRFDKEFDRNLYDDRNPQARPTRTRVAIASYAQRPNDIRRTAVVEARNDDRYMTERAKLDEKRNREMREFSAQRRELRRDLTNSTRDSGEYTRLQNRLVDLERRHTERQVEFEKEYRNIDANYSLPRW